MCNRATKRSVTELESEFRATTKEYNQRRLVPSFDRLFSFLSLFSDHFAFAHQIARGAELVNRIEPTYNGQGAVMRMGGSSLRQIKSKRVNVGRSLAADRRRTARTGMIPDQGDRGDIAR